MKKKLLVSIVMGSQSDWRVLTNAADILSEFKVTFEKKIVSAHRTPDRLYEYAKLLKQKEIEVVIAGAGGSSPSSWNDCGNDNNTCFRCSCRNKSFKGY